MKVMFIGILGLGLVGCQSIRDSQQQDYILQLADKCEIISISTRGTDLQCPNYRERSKDDGASATTKIQD
jgi:hypothetical protein